MCSQDVPCRTSITVKANHSSRHSLTKLHKCIKIAQLWTITAKKQINLNTSPVQDISLEEILHPTAFKHTVAVLYGAPGEHGVEKGKLRLVERFDFSALISLANFCYENIMRWKENVAFLYKTQYFPAEQNCFTRKHNF